MDRSPVPFWSMSVEDAFAAADSNPAGLTGQQAAQRLSEDGPNTLAPQRSSGDVALFFAQFRSPIILILIAAATLSVFLGDATDAAIILSIVAVSGGLTFRQERGASNAVQRLLQVVEVRATVVRDGRELQVPHSGVVRGDLLVLSAGATVPADSLLIEASDLFADEASLTGESFPVAKSPGSLPPDTSLAHRTNAVFMGTHIISGTGRALVLRTGAATEFGAVSERVAASAPETDFEHGVRRFGYLLMEVTLLLVIGIFAVNVLMHRPVIDSFLFSLALAVGLTPQLLPAIISVNLAHGARKMAARRVIVKRLAAIEDFGSIDVLCSDKTGTLTEGVVTLSGAYDVEGNDSEEVARYAFFNSSFESGFANPIDDAIRASRSFDISNVTKLDEEPYDFTRKRLTVLLDQDGSPLMVTKGALANVLEVCVSARMPDGQIVGIEEVRARIDEQFASLSEKGYRTLGVAVRTDLRERQIDTSWERNMTLVGLLALFDPPKAGALEAVRRLQGLGIRLKVITGDNALVAHTAAAQIGLSGAVVMTGPELHRLHERALVRRVDGVDIFAEIEPNQKEYLVRALQKAGHVVGYMGDGINDASALHAADVGVSVNSGVDVAKEAADIVLLEPGLDVLSDGIEDGRSTFANTLKYVFMATSANFGNMFSMAGASLFLPFLPLLPTQILLTNLLTDFPEMTIASDRVDPELVEKPRRWDIGFIRRFMITFGLLSSFFDYATFAALLLILRVPATTAHGQALFRTGWFVESVLSASLVVLVIRTRRPALRSRPGRLLTAATIGIAAITLAIPYTPVGALFGFTPLPIEFLVLVGALLVLYVIGAEVAKHAFYRTEERRAGRRRSRRGRGYGLRV